MFGWEKRIVEDKKLFYLVEKKKNERILKIVCIYLLSCLFDTKKLSLPDNALDEKVIGDEKYKDAKVTQDDDE